MTKGLDTVAVVDDGAGAGVDVWIGAVGVSIGAGVDVGGVGTAILDASEWERCVASHDFSKGKRRRT